MKTAIHYFSDCIQNIRGYIALHNGRVTELAERTGLENRRRETYRGFESHPFRQFMWASPKGEALTRRDG
jgi:hypothetical protein